MAQNARVLTEDTWLQAFQRIAHLPPERQQEIADYISFVLEREEGGEWELSEEELAEIKRHLSGDLSDTVALQDVSDALLRGEADAL